MLVAFYLGILLNGFPISMIAPFYPPLAYSRGLSTLMIGLIFALHPIA